MPKGSQNQGELRGSDKNILSQNSLAQPANLWFALRGTKWLFLTISFFPPSSIKSIAGSRSFEKSSSHSLDFPGSCCSLWMGCGMWKSHLWESKADTSREGGEVGLILKSGKFGREGTLKNIPWAHAPSPIQPLLLLIFCLSFAQPLLSEVQNWFLIHNLVPAEGLT